MCLFVDVVELLYLIIVPFLIFFLVLKVGLANFQH